MCSDGAGEEVKPSSKALAGELKGSRYLAAGVCLTTSGGSDSGHFVAEPGK